MVIRLDVFDDFHLHGASSPEREQRYVQLSPGQMRSALCRRLRTSRRSLQNGFRQVADTTAVHYLRSLRLNAVRRRLLATTTSELRVSQAAGDAGFEHLGHFGTRYRELFGGLPSQTLIRKTHPS